MKIDRRVRSLVDAINSINGADTFSSCGGHKNPTICSQVPASEFSVNFSVEANVRGWKALERIVAAAQDIDDVEITAWVDGGVNFELHGYNSVSPNLVATAIVTGPLTMKQFTKAVQRLEKNGRIREILDKDGKIQPSEIAIQNTVRDFPDKSDADKWRLAQSETLMELVRKYQADNQ